MSRFGRHLGKGLLAGLVGGLSALLSWTQFQYAWIKGSQSLKNGNTKQQDQPDTDDSAKEDATMKAAAKIAQFTGHQLSHQQEKTLGHVVHYSFGTLEGGIGTVTGMKGGNSGLFLPGLLFGSALFVAADEVALPKLGWSGKPSDYALSAHLYGLASHLVYGVTTEIAP
jgi:putative membrane protein